MSKIRIRDFGPIKSGFEGNQGFLDIDKITVFIGNQATGKSSVAKLISTFTWLEKALYRGDLKEKEVSRKNKFEGTYCHYHRLKNYFNPGTEIEYHGSYCSFYFSHGRLNIESGQSNNGYKIPKIMYVPAERNFLSAVDRPEKLKGIPLPLYTFLSEFDRSQRELSESITLPIGNLKFQYQKQNKIASILGDGYRVRLLEASSGLQSAVPLFIVSQNLASSINKESDTSKKEISIEEEKRIRTEIRKILANKRLNDDLKKAALEELSSKFRSACFINIVEEVEQNLFPVSQKDMLFKLLEFANDTKGNSLVLTTHSPYIVNYLTLAIKGNDLLKKINKSHDSRSLLNKFQKVIPIKSCVSGSEVQVYELEDGIIKKLPNFHGIPSDNNYLNKSLADTNSLFDELLEIEETV